MTQGRGLSRREFVALASASAAATAVGWRGQEAMTERYAAALLERCQQGKALNAFITLPQERVLEAARAADRFRTSGGKLGPLHGLPIPVKDSVNTKDMPTTGGTPALRHFQPKEDAPIVRAL